MRKGFIFDHNKCVACKSCSAACILENGWSIKAREILTIELLPQPVVNLSIACNHCEKAACMDGCPSSVYSRDLNTGAIVADDEKCIGCSYCEWNCPYGAPKFDIAKHIIRKCNFCYIRLAEGHFPACSTACPTGALSYGDVTGLQSGNLYSILPDKNLNPAIRFTGNQSNAALRVIPEKDSEPLLQKAPEWDEKIQRKDWSLVMFSFLTTISVSTIVSSFIRGVYPEKVLFFATVVIAGLASVFHLGRKLRAWKALSNFKTSPLSREIVFLVLYWTISIFALISELPGLLMAASAAGLLLLISIDSVYNYADNRKPMLLHSGQTFLSGLLIVSFFSVAMLPFIFVSVLKLTSAISSLTKKRNSGYDFTIRFFRIALLLITCASFISGISGISSFDIILISLFLTGEFLDRVIFYIDFKPLNMNVLFSK